MRFAVNKYIFRAIGSMWNEQMEMAVDGNGPRRMEMYVDFGWKLPSNVFQSSMFFLHETAFACRGMDAKAAARHDILGRPRKDVWMVFMDE